jgi:hypothetical protein
VTNDRRHRILSRLAENGASSTDGLCDICMEVIATSGVGIMLMSGAVPLGSVGMTNTVSALIEELQFTLGEGPGIDAYNLGLPIAEPDLANPTSQWPGFTPPVFEAGVRAIFAFPLQVGAVCMGALDLYRDQAGPLSDDEHADALFMAGVVAQAVLTIQAQAPPGTLAGELGRVTERRDIVHQAVGMVAVQLGVSVGEALIRLRAYAFAKDCQLAELAQDVIDRHVRFDAEPPRSKDSTP